LFTILLSNNLLAGLKESFPKGSGSKFVLAMNSSQAQLTISIAEVGENFVDIEYFIQSTVPLPLKLWQQFKLERSGNGPFKVKKGYIKSADMVEPEELTSKYMSGYGDLKVAEFLINDEKAMEKSGHKKIGNEKIIIPAAPKGIASVHYQKKTKTKTIDYWISKEAKPIGLVKLEQKGDKPSDNYTISLLAIVKNVAATIDPNKSVALTDKGKSFLNLNVD